MDHFGGAVETILFGLIFTALGIGIVAIFSIIAAIPLYFLWNWLMPDIFRLQTVTFWQAWGLGLLAGILFKPSSVNYSRRD